MASSLLDLLLEMPSASEKFASILPMIQGMQGGQTGSLSGLPGNVGPIGGDPSSAPAALAQRIAQRIERRPGFQVSGLEGFQGTGQISTGHIDNSQHYSGMAGDVTYGGGKFGSDTAALNWLEGFLQKKWGDQLTELIWQEPDHYGHLHYGTRPGG